MGLKAPGLHCVPAEARHRAAGTDRLRQEYFPPTFRKKNILLEHFIGRLQDEPGGRETQRCCRKALLGRLGVKLLFAHRR